MDVPALPPFYDARKDTMISERIIIPLSPDDIKAYLETLQLVFSRTRTVKRGIDESAYEKIPAVPLPGEVHVDLRPKNNINEYGDEVAWGVLAVISAAYAYGGLKNIGRKIGDTAGGVTKDLVEMIKKFRNRSSQEESH